MNNSEIANNYRELAIQHLERCSRLIGEDNPETYRYACLELRMSIEAITYGLVAAYRPELSLSILRKWQPSKLMNELKNIDSYVENAPTISIQDPTTGNWEALFEKEYRLSAKWLNKPTIASVAFCMFRSKPMEKAAHLQKK